MHPLTAVIALVVVMAIFIPSSVVSAQSATGAFNPQTQFQVGSKIGIRSVYGVASPRPQGGYGQSHSWNQSQQNLPTYNASITLDIQITNAISGGGIQFTVQDGVVVVDTSTIAITGGMGQISGIDRITMEGTATSTSSQSINWHMNGLTALVNGTVVAELTGGIPIDENGATTNLVVTYIATID